MESATHPRVILTQACAYAIVTRVCVNSIRIARQEKIGGHSPLPLMPIDSVDSCVTNHRIVREHRTDCSVLPGPFSDQGVKPCLGTAPPRGQNGGAGPPPRFLIGSFG